MPEMLAELDKPTDLRVYTIAQARKTAIKNQNQEK